MVPLYKIFPLLIVPFLLFCSGCAQKTEDHELIELFDRMLTRISIEGTGHLVQSIIFAVDGYCYPEDDLPDSTLDENGRLHMISAVALLKKHLDDDQVPIFFSERSEIIHQVAFDPTATLQ